MLGTVWALGALENHQGLTAGWRDYDRHVACIGVLSSLPI